MKVIDTENLGDASGNRIARDELLRQARNQRTLANSFEDLLGDGGPTEETADEMIRAIRQWRDVPSTRSLG
jgi:hypothetical protein